MADYYTSTAFTITTTGAEAELVEDAIRWIGQAVDGDLPDDEAPSDAFLAAFPPVSPDDPLSGLRAIFPDPDWPILGIEIAVFGIDDSCQVAVSGNQADVDAIAELLFRTAKSAIPFGFSYAHHCTKLRDDAFGGGYRIVTDEGVDGADLGDLLSRAFARTIDGDGSDGLVLATRDHTQGLSFWNNVDGFGRLATATVYAEASAAILDMPTVATELEWLALPPPLPFDGFPQRGFR